MFSKRPAGILWRNWILTFLVISLLLPSWANAYQVVSKTSSEEIITEGVVLETVRLKTGEGPLNVYVLKADLTSPYLKVDTIVGEDGTLNKNQPVTSLARRVGAVAAINGDFFQMKDSGRPIGLLYQGGSMLESPALRSDMYGFGLTANKAPVIDIFNFSGQVLAGNGQGFPLAGLNKPGYLLMTEASSDADALHLYNSQWGAVSRGKNGTLTGIVEAVVRNGVVTQVLTDQPGVPIPADGFVLRGHGQAAEFITKNLPAGSKVSYSYSVSPEGDKLFAAVGGQALLVEDGRLPAYFSQNITGNHARTAVGVSKDGRTLYLVAVEKSTSSDGTVHSRGMTQEELANFLISLGVWRAVNLDGGGSTTLAARALGEFEAGLINLPQGATQRAVPNAIGLFSTAPPGSLTGLHVSGPRLLLAGTRGEFKVKGYDQYFNPYRVDQASTVWSVTPAAGAMQGSVLTPTRGGSYTVTAALGNVRGSAPVQVVGPESMSALVVSPSAITLDPGKSVKLTAKVITNYGEQVELGTNYINWSVDQAPGKISGDKFTAGDSLARGEIRGTFQQLSVAIPVSVEPPGVEIQAGPEQDARAALDKISVLFPAGSLANPARIKLNYIEGPGDLPAGRAPLGAVMVSPAGGQEPTLAAPWQISWEMAADAAAGRPALFIRDEAQARWREVPSLVEETGSVKKISARVWSFGRLVLADDRRPAPSFKDTGGHWARPAIQNLAASGVIKGFPDGTFGPDQKVTRAQFVSLLAAALQWPAPAEAPVFKDKIPEWARPAVAAAVARGVVTGYPDGTFAPDARITRSEMAVIINRALSLGGTGSKLTYKDAGAVPEFARDAVAKVTAAGLMQGGDGVFRPKDGATRSETAVVVERMQNWWIKH